MYTYAVLVRILYVHTHNMLDTSWDFLFSFFFFFFLFVETIWTISVLGITTTSWIFKRAHDRILHVRYSYAIKRFTTESQPLKRTTLVKHDVISLFGKKKKKRVA